MTPNRLIVCVVAGALVVVVVARARVHLAGARAAHARWDRVDSRR